MTVNTALHRSRQSATLAIVVLCIVLAPQSASAVPVMIPTVPVGNLGNANDPSDGDSGTSGIQNFGAVGYAYRIGTTEVTIGQYTDFLNAVADTDTYLLYNTSMATNLNTAGIARSGASGSYAYSVIGSANHPVTYVSWGDAARFANWLHNGQPAGAQGSGTTETGAYTLNGATTIVQLNAVTRNASAIWFIPSENEWYKAAYHQPVAQGGDADSYWAYPMQTNSALYSDQPPGATPDNTRVGNFYANDALANGYNDGFAATGLASYSVTQNYLTDAGAYASATSPYGTFDQGGNVWEWNEALTGTFRGLRGGGWAHFLSDSLSSTRFPGSLPTEGSSYFGFRVATVPEPSTFAMAALGVLGVMAIARRRARC